MDGRSDWRGLRDVAESQRAASEIWQLAEWHCLDTSFGDRLGELGLRGAPEAGATLIAAAMYLAERSEDWGGDARDVLADLVQLGHAILARGQSTPT